MVDLSGSELNQVKYLVGGWKRGVKHQGNGSGLIEYGPGDSL